LGDAGGEECEDNKLTARVLAARGSVSAGSACWVAFPMITSGNRSKRGKQLRYQNGGNEWLKKILTIASNIFKLASVPT
jgi:hypothetical protein